eukprot:m.183830 g.183830  ORF g.183830 m.183830 type:complete len:76 (-) comp25519_c0_seq6:74-301(-)
MQLTPKTKYCFIIVFCFADDFFLPYVQPDASTERGMGLADDSFQKQTTDALEVQGDDDKGFRSNRNQKKWFGFMQ